MSRTAYYLLHNAPQATALACNTDSITIHKPNQSVRHETRENTKHKKEMAYIGKLKVEETIKIRGKRLSEVVKSDKIHSIEEVENKNKLIRADGAGAGKTYSITNEFMNSEIDGVKFLNPTHIANQNVINKMAEISGCITLPLKARIQNITTITSVSRVV